MELLLSDPLRYVDLFLLIFVRTISLFIIVPFLGNRNIPAITKIGLAFFVSTIVINVVPPEVPYASTDIANFTVLVGKEFLTGWIMGFGAYMVFSVITLAGQFVDTQIGFSMVNVFDPMSQIQLTITGNFYFYLFYLLFLITHAHYYFFKALIQSYKLIPIGGFTLTTYLNDSVISFFDQYFIIALQIAAPIFFVTILMDVVLGILARTVPQLNMFVVGFPIKIIIGLVVVYVTLNLFDNISQNLIDEMVHFSDRLIKGMMP